LLGHEEVYLDAVHMLHPRVLHRVLHEGDRPLQLLEGVSTRLMLLSMKLPMLLRMRSRGLVTMVQDF